MVNEVEWKIKGIFQADAQKVFEEIGETQVTPEEVLAKARADVNSELHKCFEWDDSIAAEKYRLGQARQIIQMLVIKPKEVAPDPPVRVFQITSQTNVYQPCKMFLTQPNEYQKLLERAKAELRSFAERYKQLSELEDVLRAINEII